MGIFKICMHVLCALLPSAIEAAHVQYNCKTRGRDGTCAIGGESILLQMHRQAVKDGIPLLFGDSVYLRVARTGHRLAAEPDGTVHAKWSNAGEWERFVVEKAAGEGAEVVSGDEVFLRTWNGKIMTVQEDTVVHSRWSNQGSWEKLKITSAQGGPIRSGDDIYLSGWTGNVIDADSPGARGVVQARWKNKGEWEKLVVEIQVSFRDPATSTSEASITEPATTTTRATSEASTTDPATMTTRPTSEASTTDPATMTTRPTSEASTTGPATAQTISETSTKDPATIQTTSEASTTEPATTQTTSDASTTKPATKPPVDCVKRGSLGKCEPCLESKQCGTQRFCCPFMKKCVVSSSETCSTPIAECKPLCHDKDDVNLCQCKNVDFPLKWQRPSCASGHSGETSPPTQAPGTSVSTPAPTQVPESSTTLPWQTSSSLHQTASEKISNKSWEHFKLLNELRAKGYTCPKGNQYGPNSVALKFDCKLWKAAKLHSMDMADNEYFSHASLDGRTPWERASAQGAQANAENIAAGRSSPSATLEQWKKSDGHCNGMMSPKHKSAGVGYAPGGKYGHYWTQMFSHSVNADESCYLAETSSEDPGPQTSSTTDQGATEQGSSSEQVSPEAWENFSLLNDLRAKGFECPSGNWYAPNKEPLVFDCKLWRASKFHSTDMVQQNYFSHTSLDGRTPWDRAADEGTAATGENIAAGMDSGSGTLQQWKESDGHCNNMMDSRAKVVAVGYAQGGQYGHYWTQMFSQQSGTDADKTCYPTKAAGLIGIRAHQIRDISSATVGAAWVGEEQEPIDETWEDAI